MTRKTGKHADRARQTSRRHPSQEDTVPSSAWKTPNGAFEPRVDSFQQLQDAFGESGKETGDGRVERDARATSSHDGPHSYPKESVAGEKRASSASPTSGSGNGARPRKEGGGVRQAAPPEPPLSRTQRRNRLRHERRRRAKRAVRIILIVLLALAVLAGAGFGVSTLLNHLHSRQSAEQIVTAQASDWPGPGYGTAEFTIKTGESAASVANRLAQRRIVASPGAFTSAVEDANAGEKIKPGTFTLKYHMRASDVVTIVTDPAQAKGLINVTANERVTDIVKNASALSKKITQSDLTNVLSGGGGGVLPAEANGKFEGWLQPGSYDPSAYTSAQQMLGDMVRKRVDFLNALHVPTGAERERILTVASIIGGEVNRPEYYGKVSRVIQNRLQKNMPLGMDSVLAYGNNVQPSQVTQAMIDDQSNAYNSRVRKGLPPTPINQPDRAMIEAAMNPKKGDWLYFVTVNLDSGETKFTDNQSQFQQYTQEYRQWQARNRR